MQDARHFARYRPASGDFAPFFNSATGQLAEQCVPPERITVLA